MKKKTDLEKLYAPFAITKVRRKVKYCNNHVIPLLKKKKITWDMDTDRIIFCGKRFPMKDIDNGRAEQFIDSLTVDEYGQMKLDVWR